MSERKKVREISLTNGMVTIVDDEDYARLLAYRWGPAKKWRHGEWVYYARRQWDQIMPDGSKKHFVREMQRDVLDPDMKATRSQISDHINHGTLDNRRENLRWKDHRGSVLNRRLFVNNVSGYRGVSLEKKTGKWRAAIRSMGIRYVSGYHPTAEAAARAYNELARLHHGEEAKLNDVPEGVSARSVIRKDNKSGYRGVRVGKVGFGAAIKVSGRQYSQYGFATAAEAAAAYNRLAVQHLGERARLNIIPGDGK